MGTPVSSTNKTERHDITEMLLKMTLNTHHTNQLPRNLSQANQKFPGRDFSLRLLYVKSNTSNTGKAPNPLGNSIFKQKQNKKQINKL
jgi:hypothetical protein